jgi:hypothetical protein
VTNVTLFPNGQQSDVYFTNYSGDYNRLLANALVFDVGTTVATPEPSTIVSLAMAGVVGLAYARRRKLAKV